MTRSGRPQPDRAARTWLRPFVARPGDTWTCAGYCTLRKFSEPAVWSRWLAPSAGSHSPEHSWLWETAPTSCRWQTAIRKPIGKTDGDEVEVRLTERLN